MTKTNENINIYQRSIIIDQCISPTTNQKKVIDNTTRKNKQLPQNEKKKNGKNCFFLFFL